MRLKYLFVIPFLALFGCASNPGDSSDVNAAVTPINQSRVDVTQDLNYRTMSNGYFFPAGEYLPVASDDKGTVYQSPNGISIRIGITYLAHYEVGGIYVSHQSNGQLSYIAWYSSYVVRKIDVPLRGIGPDPDEFIIVNL